MLLSRVNGHSAAANDHVYLPSLRVRAQTVGQPVNIIDCFGGRIVSLRFRSFDNTEKKKKTSRFLVIILLIIKS